MTSPLKTYKYMTGFRCIGPDCEDHCCRGWRIHLDAEDYDRLAAHRKRSEVVKRHFNEAVVRDSRNRLQKHYAHLAFDHTGGCFFEEAGLCAIHRDLGEEALPKTCATYPRMVALFEEGYEYSGSLSCPEVARLCLLSEDGLDQVEQTVEEALPDRIDTLSERIDERDFYARECGRVRSAVLALLATTRLDVSARLYLVLYLGRQLESFFHKGIDGDVSSRLERILSKMARPDYQDKLIVGFRKASGESPLASRFLMRLLLARESHHSRARYNQLVDSVFTSLGIDPEQMNEADWQGYRARKQRLDERFGEYIETWFVRFTRNCWAQERLPASQSLALVARRFVLCFAATRFLFYGHPEIPVLLDLGDDEALVKLKAVVVHVVQTFSKNISHNKAMLDYLGKALEDNGMRDMAGLSALLKI